MPEGEARIPISGRDGLQYNPRTLRVTQWITDPVTGIGAWTDSDMQVMVLSDKRGDPLTNEVLLGEVLAELQAIRGMMEVLSIKLS